MRFNFGRNWSYYVKNVVNEDVINQAKESLLKYITKDHYLNKVFIDVGCGSGIFSLGALLLGCREVISFDYDIESIKTTLLLKEKFKHLISQDAKWDIYQADVLDGNFISRLKHKADIVYCWGVVHHTGNMWKAIENVCEMVSDSGILILAVYNKTPVSKIWWKIKKFYNSYKFFQPILALLYGGFVCVGYILKNKTLNLYRERSMHVFYDAIDWLGGFPYEYASFDEVKDFVENKGFKLIKEAKRLPQENYKVTLFKILRAKNTGCNEFVFLKR
ncbi:MAG: class I SAM-dependent methyltransferase [Endomicrobia bacterium]|nr:class I SAM-dependent methyltransferase [Endomicrobiia bacterium]